MGLRGTAALLGVVLGALSSLASCSGERCEGVPLPVEMSLARAAELAPGVTTGVALSTALRATACPVSGPDGGAPVADPCGQDACGALRRAVEVLVVPSGVSIPRRSEGCLRTREDLDGLAVARGTSSELGELVLALETGDVSLFLVDPVTGCAACGRVEVGEGCAVRVPARGLVVRDLLLDRL